ncbi:hypothetical protein GCM10010954_30370 [Halobacillus andaensis]|uniref:Uncharacterized protein n=1 Tax=Halobacillus andaensis TaxID=1176239 RepID=A0A917B7C3_HALAA|nr:hypothetical protein [Halobacillus andaensis]MBP2005142.1 hypothetical protein [Halobacillus andaensis]GGF29153.1 hypothetical protein GCM10010954_30370 [Halobacillus andaensis]
MLPVDSVLIPVKGYHAMYKEVILDKRMPTDVQLPHLKRGIQLYLDHKRELTSFIHLHLELSEEELVPLLLNNFKKYGLGEFNIES